MESPAGRLFENDAGGPAPSIQDVVSGAPDKLRLPDDVWRPRLHIFFECLDLSSEEFRQRASVRPTIPSVCLEPMK